MLLQTPQMLFPKHDGIKTAVSRPVTAITENELAEARLTLSQALSLLDSSYPGVSKRKLVGISSGAMRSSIAGVTPKKPYAFYMVPRPMGVKLPAGGPWQCSSSSPVIKAEWNAL